MHTRKPLIPIDLLRHAREMRHSPASSETKLWNLLRNRQLNGYKFRRQHPSPPFIADFYCNDLKMVIEIDGDSHVGRQTYDASRTKRLSRDGLTVLRFTNDDVQRFSDEVLEAILGECDQLSLRNHPHPNPLPEGEGTTGATHAI